jgi:hypothetical protein
MPSLIGMGVLSAMVCGSATSQAPAGQSDHNPTRYDVNEMRLLSAEQFLTELCLAPDEFPRTVRQMNHWPRMSDLPSLIAKAEDTSPCSSVISGRSSYIPRGFSTVGREAKFLILGIRACSYPPALSSLGTPDGELDDALRWGKLMMARGEADFCAKPDNRGD